MTRTRAFYFTMGCNVGLWFVASALGFAQDLLGPEGWTRWELAHWAPGWRTMPLQATMLATAIVLWFHGRRRARLDDTTGRQ